MGYSHYWKWDTNIADAERFTAWSRDTASLQRYMATPDKLLPWEVPVTGKKIPGALQLDLELPELKAFERENALEPEPQPYHPMFIGFDSTRKPIFTVPLREPQPFTPLLFRGPDGTGEPIFTPTEVAFNGDSDSEDDLEPFRIAFHHLQAPRHWGCKTNRRSYDILVRCAIVRFAHYFPAIRFSSDGGKSVLKIPVAICRYVFEDDNAFPHWMHDDD